MDEYTEIYFLDEDEERNAVVNDHRKGAGSGANIIRARPGTGSTIGRPVVVRHPSSPRPVVVSQPSPQSRFAGLSTGELVEVGTQVLAAIQPLPAAPVATGKVDTDVANLTLYQNALAVHAKRDEQLRTLGSLVGKLFG